LRQRHQERTAKSSKKDVGVIDNREIRAHRGEAFFLVR
jgi:hypothetical protein